MIIYLAARYSRFKEMQKVRADLEAIGHIVSSRWINGDHNLDEHCTSEEKLRLVHEDIEDLCRADCVMSFTEVPRATNSRGGRHVEFGIGLVLDKRLIVIGPRENVFHHYPSVEWYPDYQSFYRCLKAEDEERFRSMNTKKIVICERCDGWGKVEKREIRPQKCLN